MGFSPLISSVKSPVWSRLIHTTEQNRSQLSSYIQFFWNSMGGKVPEAERCFLQGVLAIVMVFTMVNRGEIVVNCVVNVDSGRSLLWSRKVGQGLEVYFCGGHGWLRQRLPERSNFFKTSWNGYLEGMLACAGPSHQGRRPPKVVSDAQLRSQPKRANQS